MEKWIRQSGSSTEAVAKRSRHKTAHVLDLFADENPNPSLRLYLELASVAGARFSAVQDTTPAAVVAHLATVAKDNEITLASLARASSVGRPLLSTLFNDPDPNPSLATIDRIVTALDAASDFDLVPATQAGDEDGDQAEDGEAEDGEAEDDDGARGDEQAAVVGALREQNTQLQRRVVTKEAEIDHLREQGRWSTLKKLATAVGGGLVGAGITVAVLKRRKD